MNPARGRTVSRGRKRGQSSKPNVPAKRKDKSKSVNRAVAGRTRSRARTGQSDKVSQKVVPVLVDILSPRSPAAADVSVRKTSPSIASPVEKRQRGRPRSLVRPKKISTSPKILKDDEVAKKVTPRKRSVVEASKKATPRKRSVSKKGPKSPPSTRTAIRSRSRKRTDSGSSPIRKSFITVVSSSTPKSATKIVASFSRSSRKDAIEIGSPLILPPSRYSHKDVVDDSPMAAPLTDPNPRINFSDASDKENRSPPKSQTKLSDFSQMTQEFRGLGSTWGINYSSSRDGGNRDSPLRSLVRGLEGAGGTIKSRVSEIATKYSPVHVLSPFSARESDERFSKKATTNYSVDHVEVDDSEGGDTDSQATDDSSVNAYGEEIRRHITSSTVAPKSPLVSASSGSGKMSTPEWLLSRTPTESPALPHYRLVQKRNNLDDKAQESFDRIKSRFRDIERPRESRVLPKWLQLERKHLKVIFLVFLVLMGAISAFYFADGLKKVALETKEYIRVKADEIGRKLDETHAALFEKIGSPAIPVEPEREEKVAVEKED